MHDSTTFNAIHYNHMNVKWCDNIMKDVLYLDTLYLGRELTQIKLLWGGKTRQSYLPRTQLPYTIYYAQHPSKR